jgi:hypothetical protein
MLLMSGYNQLWLTAGTELREGGLEGPYCCCTDAQPAATSGLILLMV